MALTETTAKAVSYLLSREEPKVPYGLHWTITKLSDDLPIIASMFMISSPGTKHPFLTNRIRRLNPDVTFFRVNGMRGNLPEVLFNLLPSKGKASRPYPIKPPPLTREDKIYNKIARAFTPDGIFHDVRFKIAVPPNRQVKLHRLQVVYESGRFWSWRHDNPEWLDAPHSQAVDREQWERKQYPITKQVRLIYDLCSKHRSLHPLE